MTTDFVPLKQCDHVVFVNKDGAHHSLVSFIHNRDTIDLVYMTINPDGSPRLNTYRNLLHKSTAADGAAYWWVPGDPS